MCINLTQIKQRLVWLLLSTCLFLVSAYFSPAKAVDWLKEIKTLERKKQSNPKSKKINKTLAIYYNNYAMALANQKDWAHSISYFLKALKIEPRNDVIRNNLADTYFQQAHLINQNIRTGQGNQMKRQREAKALVEKAIQINPSHVAAYMLLGDIEYFNQKMRQAKQAFRKAAELDPDNQYIQDQLTRVERESRVETRMESEFDRYFIIKIDENLKRKSNLDVKASLATIRRALAKDFKYKQKHKIAVIVYDMQTFRSTISHAPSWSGALYDGKMRIPISTRRDNIKIAETSIYHEYTHAVIHAIANGHCPLWVNEGIAEYIEYKYGIPPSIDYLKSAYAQKKIPPWNALNSAFSQHNTDFVNLGYQQAYSIIFYFVKHYKFRKINTLLKHLSKEIPLDAALKQTYRYKAERLEEKWLRWLPSFLDSYKN